MATHASSTLAWEIPWTEKPGGLQSMRLQRVGHDSNSIQHIYIHVKLNHFAISETEKILQTNYTSINKFKNYKQKTPQAIR